MDTSIKIFIVEDEMLIGAKISMLLLNVGYEVTGILPRGEEAILHVEKKPTRHYFARHQSKNNMDGIETAIRLQHR